MNRDAVTTAAAVANYFLFLARKDRRTITHLKLQKLIAIAHGYFLALTDHSLFDEPIAPWNFGPVVESLYHEFKRFGHYPISATSIRFDHYAGKFHNPVVTDPTAKHVIEWVWKKYGCLTSVQLVEITHAAGTPWRKAYDSGAEKLDNADIKTHYQGITAKFDRE
ncbi:MAG: DUF4065 domain-containing protein [Bacteroidota bacterium]|nr:DUF4065 domain-containing protein [Bacteroidota bacterium]